LVANKKQRANWMFFVDGQRSLQDLLVRVFAWQGTIQLILDWYHLIKKCKEALGAAPFLCRRDFVVPLERAPAPADLVVFVQESARCAGSKS
jgi:hypothetical protein